MGAKVVPLPVSLRLEDVLRFLGYPAGVQPKGRSLARLEELLPEARALVRAQGSYVLVPTERAQSLGLEPLDAVGLVIGAVTAGHELERRASEWLQTGDALGALLLDAAGSAAAEEAADRLGGMAVAKLSNGHVPDEHDPAARISCRISPGYGRWKLSAQRALLAFLPQAELGIELLPSLLMLPRKSISFAMWLGADARPLAGLSGCAHCALQECRYRRRP